MNVMQYPPILYLQYLGDHIHDTLRTYLFLWRLHDENYHVYLSREEVTEKHHFGWVKFYNDIRKLAHNDLLEYAWADDVLVVILAGTPKGYDDLCD